MNFQESKKRKKAVNLAIDADLLADAKSNNLNLSRLLEEKLREDQARRWREENREALEAHADHVKQYGTLAERLKGPQVRQFDVVANPDRSATESIPYLVILQHDHVRPAPAILVASIAKAGVLPRIEKLTFDVTNRDEPCLVLAYDIAAFPEQRLGGTVANLAAHRDRFIAAIDLLFIGF